MSLEISSPSAVVSSERESAKMDVVAERIGNVVLSVFRPVQRFAQRKKNKYTAFINSLKRPKSNAWDWRDEIISDQNRFRLYGHRNIKHWKNLKRALFEKREKWVCPVEMPPKLYRQFYIDTSDWSKSLYSEKPMDLQTRKLELEKDVVSADDDDDEAEPSKISAIYLLKHLMLDSGQFGDNNEPGTSAAPGDDERFSADDDKEYVSADE